MQRRQGSRPTGPDGKSRSTNRPKWTMTTYGAVFRMCGWTCHAHIDVKDAGLEPRRRGFKTCLLMTVVYECPQSGMRISSWATFAQTPHVCVCVWVVVALCTIFSRSLPLVCEAHHLHREAVVSECLAARSCCCSACQTHLVSQVRGRSEPKGIHGSGHARRGDDVFHDACVPPGESST